MRNLTFTLLALLMGSTALLAQEGNVGIGTNSPSNKLTVEGGTSDVGVGGATVNRLLMLRNNLGGSAVSGLQTTNGGTTFDFWYGINPTINGVGSLGFFSGNGSGNHQWLQYNFGTSDVGFTGPGNVGIGTATPGRELDVVGHIRFANNNSLWARNAADTDDIRALLVTNANNIIIGSGGNPTATDIRFDVSTDASPAGGTRMLVHGGTGNVGIGTLAPTAHLHIQGNESSSTAPLRATGMQRSNDATVGNPRTANPVIIDLDGVMMTKFNPVSWIPESSYHLDTTLSTPPGTPVTLFTGITGGTIVSFKFYTNYALGAGSTANLYGTVSFSSKMGFRVNSDWISAGGAITPTLDGSDTPTLTFNFGGANSNLVFSYSAGNITVHKTGGGGNLGIGIWEGMKMR